MKSKPYFLIFTFAVLLAHAMPGSAEDIDLYSSAAKVTGTDLPNVLFVLDNAANFDSATSLTCTYDDTGAAPNMIGKNAGIEQCALNNAINALPLTKTGGAVVNIGIMAYNASGFATQWGCNSSANGGCLVKPLTAMTAANKAALMDTIKSWTATTIKANNEATAQVMQEAWAYYAGKTGMSGTTYTSTALAGCQKNFVIFIGNAATNAGTPGDASAAPGANLSTLINTRINPVTGLVALTATQQTSLKSLIQIPAGTYGTSAFSCGTYTLNLSNGHGEGTGLYADEWSRYMKNTDLVSGAMPGNRRISTYTIGVLSSACKPDYPALLTSMAAQGSGKYFATSNAAEIQQAILRVLNEVQAVNSVFSSSSLPVSVNTQGTFLNQIYMGMFRPDSGGLPRWKGNLKQYQFAYNPTLQQLYLADATGTAAVSAAGTGFLSPNASSFWTCTNTTNAWSSTAPFILNSALIPPYTPYCVTPLADPVQGFWANDPNGVSLNWDLPDGEVVEKGGAAQMLRLANLSNNYVAAPATTTNPRNLYTYFSGTSLNASANAFDTSNTSITDAMLGTSATTLTRDTLTRWVRGEDNLGDELSLCPPGSTAGTGNCPTPTKVNIRPSVHGDVLHSRPVVINYGGTTGVVVFYGDNGGVFHAINGNQSAAIGSVGAGGELWGFIPTEFFARLKRLHDNSPLLQMPSTPTGITPTPQRKDYFIDGATGLYQTINASGVTTKAILYLAMRRGGRFIYALDVTTPSNPIFLWKHSNADTGFGELGQTWSQPEVAMVQGYTNPVLIFGAGYDAAAEDLEAPAADTMGRGIFVLDALTGAVVWSATPASTVCKGSPTPTSCAAAGMNYSIPSDITLLDRNHDGKIDRLYVGDMGGNVWRVDLEPAGGNTPTFWQAVRLAALGCNTGTCTTGTTPRKIFYPPEVITTTKGYDVVFLGTGDREHPLYTDPASTAASPIPSFAPAYSGSACSVANRAYLLEDSTTASTTDITEANLFDATLAPWTGTPKGYYITFKFCEKAVNAPLVTAGYIYFGTNQAKPPSTQRCEEALGEATGYKLSPFSGTYIAGEFEGGGLPPSPVSGVVNVVVNGKTMQIPFCIGCGGAGDGNTGCGGDSALSGCKPPITVSTKRNRTYWYTEGK